MSMRLPRFLPREEVDGVAGFGIGLMLGRSTCFRARLTYSDATRNPHPIDGRDQHVPMLAYKWISRSHFLLPSMRRDES